MPQDLSYDDRTTQTKSTKVPSKMATPKKVSVVVTKEDVKKVKGPPTKRKAPLLLQEASEEEKPSGSECDPGNSNSDSANSATEFTPKRGRS